MHKQIVQFKVNCSQTSGTFVHKQVVFLAFVHKPGPSYKNILFQMDGDRIEWVLIFYHFHPYYFSDYIQCRYLKSTIF